MIRNASDFLVSVVFSKARFPAFFVLHVFLSLFPNFAYSIMFWFFSDRQPLACLLATVNRPFAR